MNSYGLKGALSIIAASVVVEPLRGEETQSQVLHRWIGERHMHEQGLNAGTGNPIAYSEKDLRRAIAYLRVINLIGAGVGRTAQQMRERVRDVASWHTNGWVIATQGDVYHTDDTDHIWYLIDGVHPYMVIPCSVDLLSTLRGGRRP